jgi:hypothetical protein
MAGAWRTGDNSIAVWLVQQCLVQCVLFWLCCTEEELRQVLLALLCGLQSSRMSCYVMSCYVVSSVAVAGLLCRSSQCCYTDGCMSVLVCLPAWGHVSACIITVCSCTTKQKPRSVSTLCWSCAPAAYIVCHSRWACTVCDRSSFGNVHLLRAGSKAAADLSDPCTWIDHGALLCRCSKRAGRHTCQSRRLPVHELRQAVCILAVCLG